MNAKERKALAERLAKIARHHRALVEIENTPKARCTTVTCEFEEVSISFDIDHLLQGGICAHWYGAKRDLKLTPAVDSVNECHRRKATMYASTAELFVERFTEGCKLIHSGGAFL